MAGKGYKEKHLAGWTSEGGDLGKSVKLLLLFFGLLGLGGGFTMAGIMMGEKPMMFSGLLLMLISLVPFFISAIGD